MAHRQDDVVHVARNPRHKRGMWANSWHVSASGRVPTSHASAQPNPPRARDVIAPNVRRTRDLSGMAYLRPVDDLRRGLEEGTDQLTEQVASLTLGHTVPWVHHHRAK